MDVSKAAAIIKKYRFGIIAFILLTIGTLVARPQLEQVINVSNATRKLPIYCVDTPDKKVSISFDAAWGADDTDELIKILADNNVKATFFLVGDWVKTYPEQTKKIAAAGHEIGNHSNKHPHMAKLSHEQIKDDLMKAHNNTKELLGIEMNLFRPPFGEYNNTVLDAAKECGYYTIQWDIESLDIKTEVLKRTSV